MISSRENSRLLVEDFLRLPISSVPNGSRAPVGVRVEVEAEHLKYEVGVELTSSRLWHGGKRWWWLCPRCGARRSVLLLWGTTIGCRGCLGAVYRSQRAWPRARAPSETQTGSGMPAPRFRATAC